MFFGIFQVTVESKYSDNRRLFSSLYPQTNTKTSIDLPQTKHYNILVRNNKNNTNNKPNVQHTNNQNNAQIEKRGIYMRAMFNSVVKTFSDCAKLIDIVVYGK